MHRFQDIVDGTLVNSLELFHISHLKYMPPQGVLLHVDHQGFQLLDRYNIE